MNTTTANKFGIEIETVGLSREALANAIARALNARVSLSYHGMPTVTLADGREWKVTTDGSLNGYNNGEIVSPILSYSDLCGIHIHVDGSSLDARGLLNLVNMVHKQERLIERALGVSARRLSTYTKALNADFIARLEARRVRSLSDLRAAWYGSAGASVSRYDQSRYHGLNLNSLFYRGTVEFRYFEGTLHAGEIKSYVQLCLALVQKAQSSKSTSRARRVVDATNEKWAFKLFLKGLGMVGDEFKTARFHLSKRLQGNGANPKRTRRPAEATPVAAA